MAHTCIYVILLQDLHYPVNYIKKCTKGQLLF